MWGRLPASRRIRPRGPHGSRRKRALTLRVTKEEPPGFPSRREKAEKNGSRSSRPHPAQPFPGFLKIWFVRGRAGPRPVRGPADAPPRFPPANEIRSRETPRSPARELRGARARGPARATPRPRPVNAPRAAPQARGGPQRVCNRRLPGPTRQSRPFRARGSRELPLDGPRRRPREAWTSRRGRNALRGRPESLRSAEPCEPGQHPRTPEAPPGLSSGSDAAPRLAPAPSAARRPCAPASLPPGPRAPGTPDAPSAPLPPPAATRVPELGVPRASPWKSPVSATTVVNCLSWSSALSILCRFTGEPDMAKPTPSAAAHNAPRPAPRQPVGERRGKAGPTRFRHRRRPAPETAPRPSATPRGHAPSPGQSLAETASRRPCSPPPAPRPQTGVPFPPAGVPPRDAPPQEGAPRPMRPQK